uniref:Coatomer subunit zeta n=1 Tax=Accipiter nisus TaxID=211598 RepID=A0A8B9MB84_9AVES
MEALILEPSLYTVKAVIILDNDGDRLFAKYYDDTYPSVKEQKAFEKNIFNKTHRTDSECFGDGDVCVPWGGAVTPVGVCGGATGVTPGCAHRRDRAARGADRRLQEQHRPLLLRHRQLPRERGGWRHPGVVVGDTARGARAGGDTQGWWVGDTRVAGWGRGGITGQGGGYLGVPGQGTQRGCAERSQDREGTQKVPPSRGGVHLGVPPSGSATA